MTTADYLAGLGLMVAGFTLAIVFYQVFLMVRQTQLMERQGEIIEKQDLLLAAERARRPEIKMTARLRERNVEQRALMISIHNTGTKELSQYLWHVFAEQRILVGGAFTLPNSRQIGAVGTRSIEGRTYQHFAGQGDPALLFPDHDAKLGYFAVKTDQVRIERGVVWWKIFWPGSSAPIDVEYGMAEIESDTKL